MSVCQGAFLLTGNHNYKKETFDLITGPITVEDGVWVGAKAVVCPGIKLGSHSVVSVGSVLTKDSEGYGIYRGVPAACWAKSNIVGLHTRCGSCRWDRETPNSIERN